MPQENSIPLAHQLLQKAGEDSTATSLFTGHDLQPSGNKPDIHLTPYDYSLAALLFVAFILFAWLYVNNRKRLNQIIRAFYVGRYASQLSRDEVTFGNRVSIFLSVLFIIIFTVFLNQVNAYFGFYDVPRGPLPYIKTGTALILIYGIKILLIRLLGVVFLRKKEASEYLLALMLFGCTLGLFLMPVVIGLAFARQADPRLFIITGLGLTLSFLLIRTVREVVIGLNSARVSGFYLFLYLCTLEILPFVVLVKLFMLRH